MGITRINTQTQHLGMLYVNVATPYKNMLYVSFIFMVYDTESQKDP